MSSLLKLEKVSKSFQTTEAVSQVSFSLEADEHLALLGESGSGKSTLLRLIAGFEQPDEGRILLEGKEVSGPGTFLPPHKRKVGMVFQDNALFPHLTVAQNIGFGVESRMRTETVLRLLEMIDMVKLSSRYPHELSGGQQQRVAIARSLAAKPSLLLLDEPFSSLDPSIRYHVRDEAFRLLRQSHTPSILVTHDIEDALSFSNRLVVIKDGRIVQSGQAAELYSKPVSSYVASLFGPINVLEQNASELQFVRPHEAKVNPGTGGKWSGNVEKSIFHGDVQRLHISGEGFNFVVDSMQSFSEGAQVHVVPFQDCIKTTQS